MINPLLYQMAAQAGGTPAEILERAEKIEEAFAKNGIELVAVEDDDENL